MGSEFVLRTNALSKKYGGNLVVDSVSMNVKKGRIYGLLGRNGAGKTTVMKMILGLTSISDGYISVFDEDLKSNEESVYSRIGSIIETPGFYSSLTGSENLRVFARLRGKVDDSAIRGALSVVGLPYGDKKRFSSYSLGMKQRLGIANALLSNPELLILDEPTNGLDPIGIAEIRAFLKSLCREEGKTIIVSSHILSEMELLADDIGIIHEGVLLEECTLEELQERSLQYVLVQLSDVPGGVDHLNNVLGIVDFSVEDDNYIRIYDLSVSVDEIGKSFVLSGFLLSHLELCKDSLEDYFKRVTGGVGIA